MGGVWARGLWHSSGKAAARGGQWSKRGARGWRFKLYEAGNLQNYYKNKGVKYLKPIGTFTKFLQDPEDCEDLE